MLSGQDCREIEGPDLLSPEESDEVSGSDERTEGQSRLAVLFLNDDHSDPYDGAQQHGDK